MTVEQPNFSVELVPMDRGKLKGIADVSIQTAVGEITLRGFKIIKADGEPPWVAFPSNSYTKDGKVVNAQIIETSRGLRRRIIDEILAAYEDHDR